MKNLIKKISYHPAVVNMMRFFGLGHMARAVYYYILKPKNNILEVSIAGHKLKYSFSGADEFRLAESVTSDEGEKKVIESFLSDIVPDDCVFDVGANIGIYSVVLAKVVGSKGLVVAFEPEKESCARLQESLTLNNVGNVKIVKKALGEINKKGRLSIGKTTGNFSLKNLYEKEIAFQEVDIVNGDDFRNKENLPVPKAVKIDVEGYEYQVLLGLKNTLKNPSCRVLCCEIHPLLLSQDIGEKKVLEFIQELGFNTIKKFTRHFSAYHVICKKD